MDSGKKLLALIAVCITLCAIVGAAVYIAHRVLSGGTSDNTPSSPQSDSDSILPLDCPWIKAHRANSTNVLNFFNNIAAPVSNLSNATWSYSDSDRYFYKGCGDGDLTIVQEMITEWGQNIVDMGHAVHHDKTCLYYAAWQGRPIIARYLVDGKGANVNIGESDNTRPIHKAAGKGNLDMVRYLALKGAKINVLDHVEITDDRQCKTSSSSMTPLDWAIMANSTEVADYLIGIGGKKYCLVTEGCVVYQSSAGLGWNYAPNQ